MTGLYAQGFTTPLTRMLSSTAGDQLLQGGGLQFQLFPVRLPDSTMIEIEFVYRATNFTTSPTLKAVIADTPTTVSGENVFSVTVPGNGWQTSGSHKVLTPTVDKWLNIVSNSVVSPGTARIDEASLYIQSVLGGNSYFLTF